MEHTPTPPSSIEAEEAVLGSILLDPSCITLLDELVPDDFYLQKHKRIYEAMKELPSVDIVTLCSKLEDKGQLVECGGSALVCELLNATPTAVHVQHYAGIVREKAQLRRLIDAGSEIVREAYRPDAESLAVREKAASTLTSLIPSRADSATIKFMDSLEYYLGVLSQRNQDVKSGKPRMTFPWIDVANYVPTVQPGQLMVVAAETSVGKTFFCEALAEQWAMAGFHGMFFHFELSHAIMLDRRMARWSGVSIVELWNGVNDWRVEEATQLISEWPGSIDYIHCPGWTISRVVSEIGKASIKRDVDFVIVDYLQKAEMPPNEYSMNKAQVMGRDVELLKNTAERLNPVIVVASQLNRGMPKDARKTGRNTRDSGEIEEKANILITLDRPILDLPLVSPEGSVIANEGERSPQVTVRVDKNTMGRVGECKLLLLGSRFKLVNSA